VEGTTPEDQTSEPPESGEGVGDALRAAVERTLSATAGSATETRQRAQGLLDDVVRRGQVAREEVARRGEVASARLAEAIGELRAVDDQDRDAIMDRLAGVERRIARLEGRLETETNPQAKSQTSAGTPLAEEDSGA